MAGNIIGIIAQRLVRRLCEHCKTPYHAEGEMRLLGPLPTGRAPCCSAHRLRERCDFQGYRGRAWRSWNCCASNAGIDELIARRAPRMKSAARALLQGFTTLADDGLRRVLDGVTSLEELARVVDLTDRM